MTKPRAEIDAEKAAKPRPDLIPGAALTAMGEVMAYGYGKHGRCTWRHAGTEQAKPETHIASAFRHLAQMGADYDDLDDGEGGSGLPHLHHALSQLAIAVECMSAVSALSSERLSELRDAMDRTGLTAEPADESFEHGREGARYSVTPDSLTPRRPWLLTTEFANGLVGTQLCATKAEAMAEGERWLAAQRRDEAPEGMLDATVHEDGTIAVDGSGWHAVACDGQWYPAHIAGLSNAQPRSKWWGAKIVEEPSIGLIRSLLPEGWRIERDDHYDESAGLGWDLYAQGTDESAWTDLPAALLAVALHKAWIEPDA